MLVAPLVFFMYDHTEHWIFQNNKDGTTAQCFTLSFKEENCCFECSVFGVRVQMHWESSGCYSESFQDPLFSPPRIPPPLLFFFWHFHIRQCGSWSNPLLCQSSCSLLWPGSIVKQLVFISVGERQGSVSSPLPLQMCLDQGKLTMRFVFFKTLMWLCHIFSADSHCY